MDLATAPLNTLIPADRIVPDPANGRGVIGLDAPENVDLGKSIIVHGVIVPLLVFARPDGRFDLSDGHRRFAVGVASGVTHFPVWALPGSFTPADRAVLQVTANLQRSDVSDMDLAEKLAALLAAQQWSQKHLAGLLGKSEPTLSRLLQLARLADPVKRLVRDNRLAATAAVSLSQLPPDEQITLAEQLAAGTLDRGGLAKAIRKKQPGRAGRKPTSAVRAFRFGTGRGEEIVVKAAGELTPAGLIERLKSLIAAAERAEKQGLGTRVVGDFLKAMTRPLSNSSPA